MKLGRGHRTGKSIDFLFVCCTSGSTLWLGPHDRIMYPHNRSAPRASPHDRIMRSWIHHGCTMNLWPHDWIMRLWIHGTQGIGHGALLHMIGSCETMAQLPPVRVTFLIFHSLIKKKKIKNVTRRGGARPSRRCKHRAPARSC